MNPGGAGQTGGWEPVVYRPIGHVSSPHREMKGTPVQPAGARGIRGTVHILPEYRPGLDGLGGFSHIWLLYHCHRSGPAGLTVVPYLDREPRGVFATRAPARPNPLGISVVRLRRVEDTALRVEDLDLLDGTPVLDVKPYVPAFDTCVAERIGWLEERVAGAASARADDRFGGTT